MDDRFRQAYCASLRGHLNAMRLNLQLLERANNRADQCRALDTITVESEELSRTLSRMHEAVTGDCWDKRSVDSSKDMANGWGRRWMSTSV